MNLVEPALTDYIEARSMEKSNRAGRHFVPSDKLPEALEMPSAVQVHRRCNCCVCRKRSNRAVLEVTP